MHVGDNLHKRRKKPSGIKFRWVFAIFASLFVHGMFLGIYLETRGVRSVQGMEGRQIIQVDLQGAAYGSTLTEEGRRKVPHSISSLSMERGEKNVAHESRDIYLEPSQVDLTAKFLEEPVLNVEDWPSGVDELRIAVWISETGRVVGWSVQGFEKEDDNIQHMFEKFLQTKMSPAFIGGRPVASVSYLALGRP
jgi:hypothetical protein